MFPYEGPQEDCAQPADSWKLDLFFFSTLTVVSNWLGVHTLSAKPSERPEPVDNILPVLI